MPTRRTLRYSPHRRRQVIKNKTLYQHGCLVQVFGQGVLLLGPSGSGKSLTAFSLIRSGHALIADDMVQIKPVKSGLIGQATPPLAGFLHIHGVGLLDIGQTCGQKVLLKSSQIHLIIECLEPKAAKTYNYGASPKTVTLAGVKLPIYKMKPELAAAFVEAAALKEKSRSQFPEKKLAQKVRRLLDADPKTK